MRIVKIGGVVLVRFEEVWVSDGFLSLLRSFDMVVVYGGLRYVDEFLRKFGVKIKRFISFFGVIFRRIIKEVFDVYLVVMMRVNREFVEFF